MRVNKTKIVSDLIAKYGMTVNRTQVMEYVESEGIAVPYWITNRDQHRAGRGLYTLANLAKELNISTSGVPAAPISNEVLAADIEPEKSDSELIDEIRCRFTSLTRFAETIVDGKLRSLIVSGNAGIGKTYTLETILERAADDSKIMFRSVKGYVKATGLYKLMWEHRFDNCVLLFDDADSIFQDECALNLLKSALDTTRRRRVSWLSEKSFKDEAGEEIPDSFNFEGCIIFVTNLNFDRMSKKDSRLAPHFQALISRSFYIDLNLLSAREMMIRIEDVISNTDILTGMCLTDSQSEYVLLFMRENMSKLRELSLRMVIKLGRVVLASKGEKDFVMMAKATCMTRA
jgi:hypothetical protein